MLGEVQVLRSECAANYYIYIYIYIIFHLVMALRVNCVLTPSAGFFFLLHYFLFTYLWCKANFDP